jgi:hypothetical protein
MTFKILGGAKLDRGLELASALLRRADDLLRLRARLPQRYFGFMPRLLRNRLDEAVECLLRGGATGASSFRSERREFEGAYDSTCV